MLYTERPSEIQGESTKNCPHCGYENGHYVEDVGDHEHWECDYCGKGWERPIDEDECIHEAVVLTAFEVAEVVYDTQAQEFIESDAPYGYHVTEGICMDCERVFTADELIAMGISSIWKMKVKLVKQTPEHADEFTTHPKYGRMTHYQRGKFYPTVWMRIKRRISKWILK